MLDTIWQLWSDLVTSVLNPGLVGKDSNPWVFFAVMAGMILVALIPMMYTIHQADKVNAKFPMRSLLYACLCIPSMMIFIVGTQDSDPVRWEEVRQAKAEYEALRAKYQDDHAQLRSKFAADTAALEKKYNVEHLDR